MLDEIISAQSGFYESSSSSSSSSSTDSLDKDDFLQLLVTQLEHQDPLNPLDDKEFIAQLAQFSSLEQMQNIASSLDTLNKTVSNQDALSAANYLGKSVVASGNTITKLSEGITPIYFTLGDDAASVTVNVYDQNGNIVQSSILSSMQAGEYTYAWDGLDYDGNTASNGQYNVYFSAKDAKDSAVLVDTEVTGTIVGVENTSDGVSFKLSDGRSVGFNDITMIADVTASAADSTESSENSETASE